MRLKRNVRQQHEKDPCGKADIKNRSCSGMRGDDMRKMLGLIVAVLALSVLGVNAQETQRLALAEELLSVMNMQ
jgi:hypothetical protein